MLLLNNLVSSIMVLISGYTMKRLKIPKRQSEAVNQRSDKGQYNIPDIEETIYRVYVHLVKR
jgi:hypothetical protein